MTDKPDDHPPGGEGGKEPPPQEPAPGTPKPKRQYGVLRGRISIGPEFFEPLPPYELELWYQG